MVRTAFLIIVCFFAVWALCETPKYEVATILEVKPHQAVEHNSLQAVTYEVSVRVRDTIFAVVYTDTLGTGTVKFAGGYQLLVCVAKNTIIYNDILGQSQEVPIISRRPATNTKQSK
jgi:hypothetical protein